MKPITTSILTLLLGLTVQAGEIKVIVSDNSADIKETIIVTIRADFESDSIQWPAFENFVMVKDPGTGVSSTNSNGVKTYSVSKTYFLRAKKPGTLSVPQAIFYLDGKKMKSEEKTVEITGSPLSKADLQELEIMRIRAAKDDNEQKGTRRLVFKDGVGYMENHDGVRWIYDRKLTEAELKALQQFR
jgi:hypothetical protein